MLNQQIQNYKITREIGSGGMATVYEAIHTKLDTKVAIKVLNPVLATNDNIRKRFMQEAKIMATLNHEGITKVIDFDETESRLAIVMEYLDGQTLDELIKNIYPKLINKYPDLHLIVTGDGLPNRLVKNKKILYFKFLKKNHL
ncbi:MAG: protein kinase, partial [Bacteroidia bacterium]